MAAARAAFPAWAARTPGARSELLHRLVEVIEDNIDELARLETLDAGKPTTVARGDELPGIAAALRHFAGAARALAGQAAGEFVENNTSYVRREPLGVVLGITPWNFPLWQAAWKLGPALAAGNTVVIKPAELTPLATTRFVELAQEVLPAGVLNVVHGTGGVIGDALVRHPEVNLVSFTGSTAAGRTIAAAAGGAPKRLILELGGNAPVIIYDDIDLQAALPILTNGVLFNAGQECMSSTRLLVSVKTFTDEADAIAKANAVDQGLAASVWTRDIGRALRTVNAVQAGVVWVNNHMAVGPEGPLGGYKGSGYGREGGTAGLEEFTQLKQVIVNLS